MRPCHLFRFRFAHSHPVEGSWQQSAHTRGCALLCYHWTISLFCNRPGLFEMFFFTAPLQHPLTALALQTALISQVLPRPTLKSRGDHVQREGCDVYQAVFITSASLITTRKLQRLCLPTPCGDRSWKNRYDGLQWCRMLLLALATALIDAISNSSRAFVLFVVQEMSRRWARFVLFV